jgi:hypothetical protein
VIARDAPHGWGVAWRAFAIAPTRRRRGTTIAPLNTAADVAEARQDAAEDPADERKVAPGKCEALAGDARKACKDSADAQRVRRRPSGRAAAG